jgi:hypothetical protein
MHFSMFSVLSLKLFDAKGKDIAIILHQFARVFTIAAAASYT